MNIRENVSLKDLTTFHIGGNADYFVSVESLDELRKAVYFARERSVQVTVLGSGSNVLVSDNGVRGLVIHNTIRGIEFLHREDGVTIASVGAGVVWDDLVQRTVEEGLWGIENLSAIPGTVGATPVQNVGAYGTEVARVITAVDAYNTDTDTVRTFTQDDCHFGYRTSYFKSSEGKKYIITRVHFTLSHIAHPQIAYKDLAHHFGNTEPSLSEIRAAVCAIRSKKFPDWSVVGTAGSFFKNPTVSAEVFATLKIKYPELPGFIQSDGHVKIALGWILDKVCSLRGVCEHGVCAYEGQALVLVNKNNASADDVQKFAKKICDRVRAACDISVEWEVTMLK